ncbi:MAG: hypothetical protein O2814_03510 [Bacteroidetes bacterium]|nr:hypothetical protein [Bacteroidota bacterium]MDA1223979.1 hypothetical protein [Bacteroidota bacterium]
MQSLKSIAETQYLRTNTATQLGPIVNTINRTSELLQKVFKYAYQN